MSVVVVVNVNVVAQSRHTTKLLFYFSFFPSRKRQNRFRLLDGFFE